MTKEDLKEIRRINAQLKRHRELLEYLTQKAETIPAIQPKERVQTSPVNSGNEDADSAIDLEIEIRREEDLLRGMQEEARSAFDREKMSFDERRIMEFRYLRCMTWEEIGGEVGYSVRQAIRIHGHVVDRMFKGKMS
ncbi:hypothetical protein [Eubacterium pyruvativorans]|uniref:hypothetical protein n=1 Tax=Eubacterium pyruvativorans TaxID=155865 RepID=UPI001565C451|nr:hypothetical protein [Eubacterium pyruvativorans]